MSIMKCGHPDKWVLKLKQNGRIYTYCLGCIVEKLGLDNLEVYGNPYMKKSIKEKVPDRTTKEVKQGQKEAKKAENKILKKEKIKRISE